MAVLITQPAFPSLTSSATSLAPCADAFMGPTKRSKEYYNPYRDELVKEIETPRPQHPPPPPPPPSPLQHPVHPPVAAGACAPPGPLWAPLSEWGGEEVTCELV